MTENENVGPPIVSKAKIDFIRDPWAKDQKHIKIELTVSIFSS